MHLLHTMAMHVRGKLATLSIIAVRVVLTVLAPTRARSISRHLFGKVQMSLILVG